MKVLELDHDYKQHYRASFLRLKQLLVFVFAIL